MKKSIIFATVLSFSLVTLFSFVLIRPTASFAEHCNFSVSPTTIPELGSFSVTVNGHAEKEYNVRFTGSTSNIFRALGSSSKTYTYDVQDLLVSPVTGQFQVWVREIVQVGESVDCSPADGITVTVGAGTDVVFTAPSGTLDIGSTTLPKIEVTGVPPGDYKFNLSGQWNGSRLKKRNGDDVFRPNAVGTITVTSICENGEALRTDCEDKFRGGSYYIELERLDGALTKLKSFDVESANSDGDGDSGSTFFPSILELVEDPLQGRFTSLGQIISLLVPMILILGGMLASLLLIWGGIKYITARGDPKAVDSARGTLTSAIIGLAILASIFAIATVLQLVFKIRVLASIATPVYAQGVDIGCEFKFAGQCVKDTFPTFGSLFTSVVNIALAAGGLLFFVIIIWGGIRYMLSRGDDKQLMDARQTLSNGVIGILIIVSAFAIIKLIEFATGANISIL